MDKDDFALLKVIASSIETIKEDLRELKEGMKSKVEISEFNQVKADVEDLKKSKWLILGASGAVSTILHFFMK